MTSAERVAKLERARKEAGLVRCAVWVPKHRCSEVHSLASALRQGAWGAFVRDNRGCLRNAEGYR